jgi:hypothetical protein
MNFTKRDLKMIALGFFTLLIMNGIYNWEDCTKGFKEGYNSTNPTEIKTK